MTPIILDTIGKLHEHRHGLFGRASRYRMVARDNPPASFGIDVAALIAVGTVTVPVKFGLLSGARFVLAQFRIVEKSELTCCEAIVLPGVKVKG